MDAWKDPIGWVVGLVTTGSIGVVLHSVATRKKLGDHKLHASETFATKGEVIRSENRVLEFLKTMDAKLDRHIEKTTR